MDNLSNDEHIPLNNAQNNAPDAKHENRRPEDNGSEDGFQVGELSNEASSETTSRREDVGSSDALRRCQNSEDLSSIGSSDGWPQNQATTKIPRSKSTLSKAFGFFKRAKFTLKGSTSAHCELSSRTQRCDNGRGGGRSGDDGANNRPAKGCSGRWSNNGLNLDQVSSSRDDEKFVHSILDSLKLPVVCAIKTIDDELVQEVIIHRYETGQFLVDALRNAFDIGASTKYFGLKLVPNSQEQSARLPWLKLKKSVFKQIVRQNKTTPSVRLLNASSSQLSVEFRFYIRYYPSNTANLQHAFLKHCLWIQLRRDLLVGKLTSTVKNLAYVVACVIQYDYGDYKPQLVDQVQANARKLVPRPEPRLMSCAMDNWRDHLNGCKRHQTQMRLFRAAVLMETYAFDYFPVRDHQRRRPYLLGFNYIGVKTIRNGQVVHSFWWHNISKVLYERQMLILHICSAGRRKQILGFECLTSKDCRDLCSLLLDHKRFYTLESSLAHGSTRRPSQLFASNEHSTVDLLNSDLMTLDSASLDGGGGGDDDDDDDDDGLEMDRLFEAAEDSDDEQSEHATYGTMEQSLMAEPSRRSSIVDSCDSSTDESCASDNNDLLSVHSSQRRRLAASAKGTPIGDSEPVAVRLQRPTQTNGPVFVGGGEPSFAERAADFATPDGCCDICKLSANNKSDEPSVINHRRGSRAAAVGGEAPDSSSRTDEARNKHCARLFDDNVSSQVSSDTAATRLGQRLLSSLTRALIQPVFECVACGSGSDAPSSDETRARDVSGRSSSNQFPLTMSIIMLCALVVLINALLSLVDALSSGLIELMSFDLRQQHSQQQQQQQVSSPVR